MSFIEILRSSRSKPATVIHRFLTNYDPNDPRRVYAFVEGDPDQAFYRSHIRQHVATSSNIFIYNCNGKSHVYDACANVTNRYPACRRVLFFVDKDVDDIIGKQWPSDPRIFTTECYSIENYLVTAATLRRYIADYVKIRKIDLSLEKVEEEFNRQLNEFYRLILPIMSWIIVMRRAGHKTILNDVDCGELFLICDQGTRKRSQVKALSYLTRVTQTTPQRNIWREMRRTFWALKKISPDRYARGKFAAWWFIQFIKRMLEDLSNVAKEEGGSISVSTSLNENNYIQLLVRAEACPESLATFLRFHLGEEPSSSSIEPRDKGLAAKLRDLAGF